MPNTGRVQYGPQEYEGELNFGPRELTECEQTLLSDTNELALLRAKRSRYWRLVAQQDFALDEQRVGFDDTENDYNDIADNGFAEVNHSLTREFAGELVNREALLAARQFTDNQITKIDAEISTAVFNLRKSQRALTEEEAEESRWSR